MDQLSSAIYECIIAVNSTTNKAYSSTIKTILRGSTGPVSSQFRKYPFFGLFPLIDIVIVEKVVQILEKDGFVKLIENPCNARIAYISTGKKLFQSSNDDELSKMIDDMLNSYYSN
jgi:hypothetical protein